LSATVAAALAVSACEPSPDLGFGGKHKNDPEATAGKVATAPRPAVTAAPTSTTTTSTTTVPAAPSTTDAPTTTAPAAPADQDLEALRRRGRIGSPATTAPATTAPATTEPVPEATAPAPTAPPTTAAPAAPNSAYAWHSAIKTTIFWAGETGSSENGGISNVPSAWDSDWSIHFGGYDDPDHRIGYLPAGFTPKENPFYFALPYNDFGNNGRKSNAASVIPWAASRSYSANQSMVKNRWIEIRRNGVSVYAQWEDVGPYEENDVAYVFGTARPKNTRDSAAGLDISPAVRDYLEVGDLSTLDWRFVDDADVPAGPWKSIVTTSGTSWN
jgi:hypothetical protein